MVLRSVFVRFYKSFNYDYLRKSATPVKQKWPWELFEDKWFPHVRIPIERTITTIVGENESGKSCLLTAIKTAVSGVALHPKDYCRHSEFFTVEEGKKRFPQFGCEWSDVSSEECEAIAQVCGWKDEPNFSTFRLFRTAPDKVDVYFPDEDKRELSAEVVAAMPGTLPVVFELDPNVALPESVPIRYLADSKTATANYANNPGRLDATAAAISGAARPCAASPASGPHVVHVTSPSEAHPDVRASWACNWEQEPRRRVRRSRDSAARADSQQLHVVEPSDHFGMQS